MKKIFYLASLIILLFACNYSKKEESKDKEDSKAYYPSKQTTTKSDLIVNNDALMKAVEYLQAPDALEKSFQPSEYNINEAAIDGISSCSAFNVISRDQLGSGGDLYWETVERNDKNKIKLFGLVAGDFDKNTKAFILDYANHLDTFCTDGTRQIKVRLVAGIRVIYIVKDWGLKVGVDGIEKIAACKELNFSESSLRVKTIGWGQQSSSIESLKGVLQNISVKKYPEASKALLDLMSAYAATTTVRPEVIPIN